MRWQEAYALRLMLGDTIAVLIGVFGSELAWAAVADLTDWNLEGSIAEYTLASSVVAIGWLLLMYFAETRDPGVIGSGNTEYHRVVTATLMFVGILALAHYVLELGYIREYVFVAIPLGLMLLVYFRWLWRQWLRAEQRQGGYRSRTLIMGDAETVQDAAAAISRIPGTGLDVVGVITNGVAQGGGSGSAVKVLGPIKDVLRVIDSLSITTLILMSLDDVDPAFMRQLGWDLESRSIELVVAHTLTDIAGPRLSARPVAGLPLIRIDFPILGRGSRILKRAFDLVAASLILVAAFPILVAVAIAVQVKDPGPLIYRQERIGRLGNPFGMLKFRSMTVGADDQLASLLEAQGTSDTPLFKVLDDPRITPIGRVLRRYSLDELPQLVNVLRGEMSLVGPRPQCSAEVALYEPEARRRLMMKPGMSGLWQVSGRSSLSWDESIRLDLSYIENWSMLGDIIILARTLRAVSTADGAV